MRKKFKVLVPIVGYVKHEVYAEDEFEVMEKAFEEEIDVSELKELQPFVKVNHSLKLSATEIETDY